MFDFLNEWAAPIISCLISCLTGFGIGRVSVNTQIAKAGKNSTIIQKIIKRFKDEN